MNDDRELRAASDRMVELLRELTDVEQAKRREPMASAAFVERAERAEELARLVFRWSGFQRELAEDAHHSAGAGGGSAPTIATVVPRRLDRILAGWREAQMRFEIAAPGSPEATQAVDEIERLRAEFHVLADEMLQSHRAQEGVAGAG